MDKVNPLSTGRIRLSPALWEQMRADVNRRAPEEACGLIAGKDDLALTVIPVTNALHSPTRFRMEPQEQLDAFLEIESQGWELIGIYHSHPQGPPGPSPTDIAEAYYPDTVTIIWSRQSNDWICRGYQIREGEIQDVTLFLTLE